MDEPTPPTLSEASCSTSDQSEDSRTFEERAIAALDNAALAMIYDLETMPKEGEKAIPFKERMAYFDKLSDWLKNRKRLMPERADDAANPAGLAAMKAAMREVLDARLRPPKNPPGRPRKDGLPAGSVKKATAVEDEAEKGDDTNLMSALRKAGYKA